MQTIKTLDNQMDNFRYNKKYLASIKHGSPFILI